MLDILRKTKLVFFVLMITFLVIGCNHKNDFYSIIYTDKEEINISESNFYLNERGTLFYYITNDVLRAKVLKESNIKEIKLYFEDSTRIVKPIEASFSHEKPSSNFMFLVKNKTHKAMIDTIDKKAMIVIIPNKTEVEELISKKVLKFEKIK